MDFLELENKMLREKINTLVAEIANLGGRRPVCQHSVGWNDAIKEVMRVVVSELGGVK